MSTEGWPSPLFGGNVRLEASKSGTGPPQTTDAAAACRDQRRFSEQAASGIALGSSRNFSAISRAHALVRIVP